MKRCLLVEALPYHWELLSPWTTMLHDLGIEVDIAVGTKAGHQEVLTQLALPPKQVYATANFAAVPMHKYAFVMLNSLANEGYMFANTPYPVPNLQLLAQLNLPSISVIHEPLLWADKMLQHSFYEHHKGGKRLLNLLADGTCIREGGFWSAIPWATKNGALSLPVNEQLCEFNTHDGGQTYHCIGGEQVQLTRRHIPTEDLQKHVNTPSNAIITLTRQAAEQMNQKYHGIDWVLPFELQERHPGRSNGPIAFAGTIDYDRKRMDSLIEAGKRLKAEEQILIIGGSRSHDFDNDRFVQTFKRQIAEQGLQSKFVFTGYLPYNDFVAHLKGCRALIPLVDDYVDAGAYLAKLPAAVPLSLGLGVPMIMNETIANKFDMEALVAYKDNHLYTGIDTFRSMPAHTYQQLLAKLDQEAQTLYQQSLARLQNIIDTIT